MIKIDVEELYVNGETSTIISELVALNVHVINKISKQKKISKKLLKKRIKDLTKVYNLTNKGMSLNDALAEAKVNIEAIQGVYGNPPDTLLDDSNKDLLKTNMDSSQPKKDDWNKIWNT